MGKAVKPLLCHMTGGNQYWMFRTDGKILRDFLCIGRQVASICSFSIYEIRDLGTHMYLTSTRRTQKTILSKISQNKTLSQTR